MYVLMVDHCQGLEVTLNSDIPVVAVGVEHF